MTYCDIYNEVFGNEKTLEDLCLTPCECAVWNQLNHLEGRTDFDHWWDNIDDSIKDDIFSSLVRIVKHDTLKK